MNEKVLFVDDDANLLSSYQRVLRQEIGMITAQSGKEGLEAMKSKGPFAVIVSDFRMPEMDGIQFLSLARESSPQSVRMMLTGHADLQMSIDAVNRDNIYRLLIKPCPPEDLIKILKDGIDQYRLVMAEKELLEITLKGSIKVLADILALVNPQAFSRATRVRRIVKQLAGILKIQKVWQLEVAAMLSQLGCITIPEETLARAFSFKELSPEEMRMYKNHPKIGSELIANIPRLEKIREIMALQNQRYGGTDLEGPRGEEIPIESRILKVALDHDIYTMSGMNSALALVEIRKRLEWYDPKVLDALEHLINVENQYEIKEVTLAELSSKMILAEDVFDNKGTLLVAKGQEVTLSMIAKLRNFITTIGIPERFKVIIIKE